MHAWERRCHDKDFHSRVVRPFEWGLEHLNGLLPRNGHAPLAALEKFNATVLANSHEFFTPPAARAADFDFDGFLLRFPSSVTTASPTNNIVHARFFPAEKDGQRSKRAVIVMPQWNGKEDAHVAICKGLNFFGISALRLSLPYHDWRMPPELDRADYMVSSNIGRTIQSVQQAVHDIRRCADWLQLQGLEKIGVMGTSVGSCVGFLAWGHDERLQVGVFNHASSYFGDVVWQGITTQHIRTTLAQHLTQDEVRQAWLSISPSAFIPNLTHIKRKAKLIVAKYDLTFPYELSQIILNDLERHGLAIDKVILPCGHYTSGKTPYKFLDGYHIVSYFVKELR
jgi:dienelactone hydrolase